MKVLGITGGIGSGKSYITEIFHSMGISCYNADNRTKALYRTNSCLKNAVQKQFGTDIMEGSEISFPKLASVIFADAQQLQRLEEIVHPFVLEDIRSWIGSEENAGKNYGILESAILLEKPMFKTLCDATLSVEAPLELRIQRVIKRDQTTRELVQERISRQWSDTQRRALVDFVITADGVTALLPQIEKVHSEMNSK